ncbi:MAG: transporter [Acidobacteriota bacterium]|nr:transporter [Acidobacteriota bacterium]
MTRQALILLLLALSRALAAEEPAVAARSNAANFTPHEVQDNSFLVEESYNQEEGVVQHISLFARDRTGQWVATFTQEWPLGGVRHQLSYSVPFARSETGARKLEDAAVNYRYQLVGSGETRFAIAPRISLYLPIGSTRDGLGSGNVSWQTLIPVSYALSEDWVVHGNAGATYRPASRNAAGDRANVWEWNVGTSLIFTGSHLLDPMLEAIYGRERAVVAPGRTVAEPVFLVSPGVRWAWSFKSGLQVVPGLAFPIGVGPSRGSRQVLLYLSFEHPFQGSR